MYNKKFLFFINLAIGLTLAIQALLHPTLDSGAKTAFMIVAIVFVNWAIFTWLAYSIAMKSLGDPEKHDWKPLLDVTTLAYQVVILLCLIFLNVLMVIGVIDSRYLVGTIVAAIILPLLVTLIANRLLKKK